MWIKNKSKHFATSLVCEIYVYMWIFLWYADFRYLYGHLYINVIRYKSYSFSKHVGIRGFVGICSSNLLPVDTLEFIPRRCFEDDKRLAAQDRLLPTSIFTILSTKMLSTSGRSCNTFADVLFRYETPTLMTDGCRKNFTHRF